MFRAKLTRILEYRHFVFVCLLCAALVRVLWLALVPAVQAYDWLWYFQRGVDIAGGRGYAVEGIPTAYWPVGYPAFLGGVFYLFGPHVVAGQAANILEVLGTILCVYYFVRKVFHSETAARISALVLAFHPNNIAYTSLLTADMFLAFLLVLGAMVFISANGRSGFWILSGLVWGLAALTKPQSIVVPAIFLLVFLADKKLLLHAGALIYLMIFAVLAPWIARNDRVLGKPVLSNNGGITLMIGNNPYARGRQLWDANVISLLGNLGADEDHMFDGQEVARDARARHVAIDYILHHPARVLALWPRKLVALYLSDVEGFYYTIGMMNGLSGKMRALYVGLRVIGEGYYFLMLLLVGVSLRGILRRGSLVYGVGLLVCLYFTMVYMLFIGDPRYHFALMPWIAMYSGIGAAALIEKHGVPGEDKPTLSIGLRGAVSEPV